MLIWSKITILSPLWKYINMASKFDRAQRRVPLTTQQDLKNTEINMSIKQGVKMVKSQAIISTLKHCGRVCWMRQASTVNQKSKMHATSSNIFLTPKCLSCENTSGSWNGVSRKQDAVKQPRQSKTTVNTLTCHFLLSRLSLCDGHSLTLNNEAL